MHDTEVENILAAPLCMVGRLFEVQNIGRRFGLQAGRDSARQPRDASPHFRVDLNADRRE